jgi:hypothetical protein
LALVVVEVLAALVVVEVLAVVQLLDLMEVVVAGLDLYGLSMVLLMVVVVAVEFLLLQHQGHIRAVTVARVVVVWALLVQPAEVLAAVFSVVAVVEQVHFTTLQLQPLVVVEVLV